MSAFVRLLRSPEGALGLAVLCLLVLVAVFAGVIVPRDPLSIAGPALLPPFSDASLLGIVAG